jgi:hypothetical protein
MPLLETPEMRISERPDRLVMVIPGLSGRAARDAANSAARTARRLAPKLTGQMASRIFPLYGKGYFGVGWLDSYTWFQEQGIAPFTMTGLAGRTIPMWIDDPYGTLAQQNPKARTRITVNGRTQVLIFRRAAPVGSYKTVRRRVAKGQYEEVQVPRSWPGAPGRIGTRESGRPMTTPGRIGGAVARGNIGVRWRHPGLAPRLFLNHAVTIAAQDAGIVPIRVYVADRAWKSRFSNVR